MLSSYKDATIRPRAPSCPWHCTSPFLYCAEPAKRTPQRADPNRTLMVLKQRCHELLIKLWVPGQLAAIPTDEAGICANPKSPVACDEQLGDSVAREILTRGRLPGDIAVAIEAKQAEFRAEPKIAIPSLGNRVDVTSEKSFADCPRRVRVLADVERWVERKCKNGARQYAGQPDYWLFWVSFP